VADRIGSDKVDFFKKVREGYLRLAEEFENNFLIINAEEDLSDNLQKICMWLKVENSK
jgi:thymidylate kinase